MAKVGKDSRLCARLARILTGHAPIGAFRERFHLDGPVDCLCGHPVESVAHILDECPLWIRKWAPRSRLLQNLEDLDPFAEVLWFLRKNPMVATFEFVDWQLKAEEELANGAEDGFYCNQLLRLSERVRVWDNTPEDRREDALDAFDNDDSGSDEGE